VNDVALHCDKNVDTGVASTSIAALPYEPLQYRPDIDGLRAVAVLAVLLFHAFPDILPGGFVGVDVFFVISGFLISRTIWDDIQRNKFTIRRFYERRVRRLFPALVLVLLSTWLIGLAILPWDEFSRIGKHVFASSIFGMNFFLWNEGGYFDIASERKPLLHLWSLSIEEQFYLLWPVILIIVSGKRARIVYTLALLGALSFVTSVFFVGSGDRIVSFYNPLGRMWELMLGAAFAYVSSFHPQSISKLRFTAPLGLALILGSCLFFSNETPFPGFMALIPIVGAGVVLISPSTSLFHKGLLRTRAMVGIGLISYPLYLWHWPLLSFSYIKLKGEVPVMYRLVLLGLSFLFAWLTYRYVERPLRCRATTGTVFWALVAAVGSLGLLGGVTYIEDGFVNLRVIASKAPFAANPRALEDWFKGVRSGTCHIQDERIFVHPPECIEPVRPRVLLWGDSHASALYPGLRALQESRTFGVSQLTQAHCPPLLDFESSIHRHCQQINDRILNSLTDLAPDVIILHAAWIHPQYPRVGTEITQKLAQTLREIKRRSSTSRVIVIGPQLQWSPSLPEVLIAQFEQTGSPPPVYIQAPDGEVSLKRRQLEEQMRPVVEGEGAIYIAPRDIFCERERCLTRVGDRKEDLVVFDYGHLTTAGSTFFMDRIANHLSIR
jgi:peptidoglycan/LPS O-acetylase OafA/YrhL